jgi:Xaa-Pro aminopeptidase
VRNRVARDEKKDLLVNWDELQRQLAESDLDAIVATTPANVTYVSDFWGLSHWSRRSAQVFAIALREASRRVCLVVGLGNADLIPTEAAQAPHRIETYGRFTFAPGEMAAGELSAEERQLLTLSAGDQKRTAIGALLDTLGAELSGPAAIALETGGLLDGDLELIREALVGWRIVPAEPLLQRARMVKSPAEVSRLRAAAQLTERAFVDAVAQLGRGDIERDVQRRMLASFAMNDALPFLTSIQSGPRTALPNGQAGDCRIGPGDLVRFDGGCRRDLYVSDIARIAVVGQPTDKQEMYYSAVVAGLEAAVEIARPGARCRDIFETAVLTVRDSGIPHYARSHCGHGIGIENYDLPRVTPDSDDVLEPGMVICLETPYYELGWGGVQAEDTFLVTPEGLERFTRTPGGLIPIELLTR